MTEVPPLSRSCGGPSLATLRRFDAGELAGPERSGVQAHVEACEPCRSTLAEFAADQAAARVAVPFGALEARLERRRPLASAWKKFALAFALPAAAAAAFLLVPREDDAIRVKGDKLDFVVRTADGARDGRDGEALHAGDQIRLRYAAEGKPYVLIVGVDADGSVFPYLTEGDRSARAATAKDFAPNAITLDADPRPERIFALFSDEPIGVDEVKPAALDAVRAARGDVERVARLPVTLDDVEQATVLLRKAR